MRGISPAAASASPGPRRASMVARHSAVVPSVCTALPVEDSKSLRPERRSTPICLAQSRRVHSSTMSDSERGFPVRVSQSNRRQPSATSGRVRLPVAVSAAPAAAWSSSHRIGARTWSASAGTGTGLTSRSARGSGSRARAGLWESAKRCSRSVCTHCSQVVPVVSSCTVSRKAVVIWAAVRRQPEAPGAAARH